MPTSPYPATGQVLFEGRPSALLVLPTFGIVLLLMVVASYGVAHVPDIPIGQTGLTAHRIALAAYFLGAAVLLLRLIWLLFNVRSMYVRIDSERIFVHRGLLGRAAMSIEMLRVIDVQAVQAFWQRFIGIGTIIIDASDRVYPTLRLPGLPQPLALRDVVNRAAVARRQSMGVREIGMGQV